MSPICPRCESSRVRSASDKVLKGKRYVTFLCLDCRLQFTKDTVCDPLLYINGNSKISINRWLREHLSLSSDESEVIFYEDSGGIYIRKALHNEHGIETYRKGKGKGSLTNHYFELCSKLLVDAIKQHLGIEEVKLMRFHVLVENNKIMKVYNKETIPTKRALEDPCLTIHSSRLSVGLNLPLLSLLKIDPYREEINKTLLIGEDKGKLYITSSSSKAGIPLFRNSLSSLSTSVKVGRLIAETYNIDAFGKRIKLKVSQTPTNIGGVDYFEIERGDNGKKQ